MAVHTPTATAVGSDPRFAAPLLAPGEPVSLNDDQLRCAATLTSVARLYNLVVPGGVVHDAVRFHANGLSIVLCTELASYDSDELTALVLAAHRNAVRVAISPWHGHLDEARDARLRANLAAQAGEYLEEDPDPTDVAVEAFKLSLFARDAVACHLFEGHPDLDALAVRCVAPADT